MTTMSSENHRTKKKIANASARKLRNVKPSEKKNMVSPFLSALRASLLRRLREQSVHRGPANFDCFGDVDRPHACAISCTWSWPSSRCRWHRIASIGMVDARALGPCCRLISLAAAQDR
jgi:hypothetical protein